MDTDDAVAALGALAQQTRLAIYRLLVEQGPEGLAAGRIGDTLGLAPATLSFHIRELSHARLIRAQPRSRFIYYSANLAVMNSLLAYLAANCCRAGNLVAELDVPAGAPFVTESAGPKGASAIKPVIHPKRRAA
jgi:ArsR family transcriptional regulator, arsenate/arsenite/antimonite-responsive transcriptional repressor